MGLEMRAFEVGFVTAFVGAMMRLHSRGVAKRRNGSASGKCGKGCRAGVGCPTFVVVLVALLLRVGFEGQSVQMERPTLLLEKVMQRAWHVLVCKAGSTIWRHTINCQAVFGRLKLRLM